MTIAMNRMTPRIISTALMMIAASAQPFFCPALRLCTRAMMPRMSATSCTKNDRMNATMPSVRPGCDGGADAYCGAGGGAEPYCGAEEYCGPEPYWGAGGGELYPGGGL